MNLLCWFQRMYWKNVLNAFYRIYVNRWLYRVLFNKNTTGGERGIRTPGRLWTYTRFPGVRLKPLIHLSGIRLSHGSNEAPDYSKTSYQPFTFPYQAKPKITFQSKITHEFSAFVRTNHLHAYTCCLMKSVRMALLRSQAVAHTFIQRSRIKFLLLISAPKN